ncbi:hypothetical protein L596_026253 [Steinernema carpocapsae]|uniref:Uncharacterized protein n=1 Tax=Steinernema carpocapsae TaxID=34508 RepID=A0A4U5M0T3_STECR|nr:hypothetical protein L596_026253 [Steinernema carpocapsae]
MAGNLSIVPLFAVFVLIVADSASNAPSSNDGNAVDQLLQNLGLGNATPGVNTTLGGLGTLVNGLTTIVGLPLFPSTLISRFRYPGVNAGGSGNPSAL